jgi:aryl-alcohol dehydrogenase-like predicted oxidoreductase
MKYSRLGNTGLVVSRASFGTMTFGKDPGAMGVVWKVDDTLARNMVARAMEAGINFFDTADAYSAGQSEEMLGRALGSRRSEVIISTKAGFRNGQAIVNTGLSFRHIVASAEASLKRLGTDYIDLYYIHRRDPFTPLEETLRALDNLIQRGMVRYAGYSNAPAWEAAKALGMQRQLHFAPFAAAQMYYSLVGRDIEHDTVPFTQDAGIGIVVWSPLASGFLTGRYTRENPLGDGGRLAGFDFLPTNRELGYRVIDTLRGLAKARGASIPQIALAWVLNKPFIASTLIGASSLAQLDDNLKAADILLTDEEMARLDTLTAPAPIYPNWFNEKTGDPAVTAALQTK